MNIYVDIDGVLLANEDYLSEGAAEFIKYIVDNHSVYWLTTHCMQGDATHAVQYLNRASEEDLTPWLNKFEPTIWSLKKTDAIDFSHSFIWYDDDCFSGEREALQAHDAENNWHEVNLKDHPNQMVKELEYLKSLN